MRNVRTMVVKIGTNALCTPAGQLDFNMMQGLAGQIAALRQRGVQVSLVSSGAIGAGMHELALDHRPRELPMLQAVAAVGQGRLMSAFAEAFVPHKIPVGQILVTRGDFENRLRYLNLRNCIHALHRAGALPIINENDTVAVDEIRFGDNDLIAAQVTNLLRAGVLVLLSVVDGLLDRSGRVLPVVQDMDETIAGLVQEQHSSRGTGGMGGKLFAAGTVQTAGEPVLIANGKTPDILLKLLDSNAIGTLIMPGAKRLSARQRWIALTARTRGAIQVDDGAAQAMAANKSLLARGIVATSGDFDVGDAVEIVNAAGRTLARGLTNYGREDLEKIKGAHTADLGRLLQSDTWYDEVVHRDDMVLVAC